MPWIVIGLAIGLVAVGVAVAAVLIARHRNPDSAPDMTGDQLFTLGVIFTGTGVALAFTVNPGMLGILALGIIYMGMGARMKRREAEGEGKGTT